VNTDTRLDDPATRPRAYVAEREAWERRAAELVSRTDPEDLQAVFDRIGREFDDLTARYLAESARRLLRMSYQEPPSVSLEGFRVDRIAERGANVLIQTTEATPFGRAQCETTMTRSNEGTWLIADRRVRALDGTWVGGQY